MAETVLPPSNWIPISSVSVVSIMLSGSILFCEICKRSDSILPSNDFKALSIWPLIPIFIAPIHALCVCTQHLPGACYFAWYFADLCLAVGGIATGFYQLARLQYCFGAADSITLHRGYSKMLFRGMNIIGVILFLNIAIFLFFCPGCMRTRCGLRSNWEFHVEYVQWLQSEYSTIWRHVYLLLYMSWDVVILALYVTKVSQMSKYLKAVVITVANIDSNDSRKIYSIRSVLDQLLKIVICTLFYELVGITVFFVRNWAPDSYKEVIYNVVELPVSISYSYACYLMMDHNAKAYRAFLRVLVFCKLNYLCCCYRRVPNEVLTQNLTESMMAKVVEGRKKEEREVREGKGPDLNINGGDIDSKVMVSQQLSIAAEGADQHDHHTVSKVDTNNSVVPDHTTSSSTESRDTELAAVTAVNININTNVKELDLEETERTTTSQLNQYHAKNQQFFNQHPHCREKD